MWHDRDMSDDRPTVHPLEVLRTRRSAKWRIHPADVLPLTIAEMDHALAAPVRDALHAAVERGDTGYAMPHPGLGESLAAFAEARWGWHIDPTAVAVAPDVHVAAVELFRILCRPGDAIVINPPVYPPFFEWVPEAGARLVEVPLTAGLRLDLAALERAFAARPAAYLLCSPHNPVGRVHSPAELAAVVALAARYEVPVVADEIHAPLTLPGATFTPILTLPGAADVALAIHSASKAWNLAGLKCAAIVTASPRMRAITDRLPVDGQYRLGHFGVLAGIAAYDDAREWLDQLLVDLGERRDQLGELLAAHLPMITWRPPEATYLAWLDCTALGTGGEPAELFRTKGRVALEPGPRFGTIGGGHVRLNFATGPEILTEAIARMAAAVNGIDGIDGADGARSRSRT
jgi:cysteine-S-conjugate beta-lyase